MITAKQVTGPALILTLLAFLAGCGHLQPRVGESPSGGCGPVAEPTVTADPKMMALACDLDHLEKHIDWYGSVVAKVPDVWGQARLTKYRQEIERQMAAEQGNFQLMLSGRTARTDQAYLANAMTLGLAAAPPVPNPAGPVQYAAPPLIPTSQTITETVAASDTVPGRMTSQTFGPASPVASAPPPAGPATPDAGDPKGLVTSVDTVFNRSQVTTIAPIGFGGNILTPDKIGLEPVQYLNQKKRFLEYLSQLRRTNEGDDTADSPGHSINLVRIPVSVLPGTRTDTGHGAEITMTLTPILGDDLLPTTFRTMVTNDLVDQLSFPLTKFLNSAEGRALLSEENRWIVRNLAVFDGIAAADTDAAIAAAFAPVPLEVLKVLHRNLDDDDALATLLVSIINARADPRPQQSQPPQVVKAAQAYLEAEESNKNSSNMRSARKGLAGLATSANTRVAKGFADLAGLQTPFSPGTRNRQAIPSSQYTEVYGAAFAFEVAFKAHQALRGGIAAQGYAHLPDVQAFLKQELDAAYYLLADEQNQDLMTEFCTPHLVHQVRTRDGQALTGQRNLYRERLHARTGHSPSPAFGKLDQDPRFTSTAALAWSYLVDSALLTDKLVVDMKEAASARGVVLSHCGAWLDYYRPRPSADARAAFNHYVTVRWPIHVFALDPVTDDQNIADQLSTRRELQLAASVAFAGGNINLRQFTQFARRLEGEYEAVELNRTQVGFGHGENTFGWRFYPRFQTPDTPGNLTVIGRDLLLGGPNRNQLLRQRRLEPGARECVALVIMPSFVPCMTLDTTSNWFGLASPKHKVFDHTQALKLSKVVQAVKTGGCGLADACLYRDGDAARLIRRADQLAARLPSQTVAFPVPTESTLGGFGLFSNGTTDLAPELYGWYGAPGIEPGKSNSLFLVGDRFSVNLTEVIVGNQRVGDVQLISRQVMRVTIPAGTAALTVGGRPYVRVHVATPYGVTRELEVPLLGPAGPPASPPAEGYTLEGGLTVRYVATKGDAAGRTVPQFAGVADGDDLAIAWADNSGSVPKEITVRFDFSFQGKPLAITVQVAADGKRFPLTSDNKEFIGRALIDQINAQFPGVTDDPNPLAAPLLSSKITVKPVGGTLHAVQPVTAIPPLAVTFRMVPPPMTNSMTPPDTTVKSKAER